MRPKWKEISRLIAFTLLFAVLAVNLYQGASIGTSIFRAVVVYLVFTIISLLATSIIVRILHDYEMRRMQELYAEEFDEEENPDNRDQGETSS